MTLRCFACAIAAIALLSAPTHRVSAAPGPTSAVPAAATDLGAKSHTDADQRFFTVRGKQIVAPDGRPFTPKGINVGNWLMPEGYMFKFKRANAPRQIYAATARALGSARSQAFWARFRERYVTEEDIRFIRNLGFDTVRVPLHWALFMTDSKPPSFEGEGWPLLDRLIGWCREAGLTVIIDLHAAPGGQTGINHDDGSGYPLFFYVRRHQTLTIALWRQIASRYRDEPTVLGYELLNEPIAPFHDTALLNDRLEPIYRQIIAAIREVDRQHLVFLAGSQWSSNFEVFGSPFDAKAVYTYHQFWSPATRMAIREYIDFSNRWNVPVFLGESGEYTDAWTHRFRTLHERHGIGWSFWTFKNLDTDSSVVSINRPAGWHRVIAAADGSGIGAVTGSSTGPSTNQGTAKAATEPASGSDNSEVRAALAEYLENIELARCELNRGYIEALGLRVPPPGIGPSGLMVPGITPARR